MIINKFILICFLFISTNVFSENIFQVETFNSYSVGYDLTKKYEVFYDTDCNLTAGIVSSGKAKLTYKIPSGKWGCGIKFNLSPVIDLTKYEFIRVYFKGDGSKNKMKIQLEEDDYSGNSDGETYTTGEKSISSTNWGYADFTYNNCTVLDWSKNKGVFSPKRIKTIEVLIVKNDDSVETNSIYLDDVILMPYLIYDYFPDKNVIINSTGFTMELKFNLIPDIDTLNFIKLKKISDDSDISININYNSSKNSVEIKDAVLTKNEEYKIIVPPIVKFKDSEYSNISYSTNFSINFEVNDYVLDSSTKKFQFLNRAIIGFDSNSINNSITISGNDYNYNGAERYLSNVGCGIELCPIDLSLLKPARLIMYYNGSDYSSLSIYKKNNNIWNKIGGTVDSIRGRIETSINNFGEYYIFSEDATTPDNLFNVNMSSKLFTPNNDGINDILDMVFYLSEVDTSVSIYVYNISGYKIKTIKEDEVMDAGYNNIEWDGKNEVGDYVDDGMYLIKIIAKDEDNSVTKIIKTVGVKR